MVNLLPNEHPNNNHRDDTVLAIERSQDQRVHLQNMQEIENLMTLMGSNTSQTSQTDTSSLTNSNNAPASSPMRLNNVCPVTMSTNNHALTPNLPPHDILGF